MDTAPTAERRSSPTFLQALPFPVPWNAELFLYLAVQLVMAILCLLFDSVNAANFFEVTKWTTAGYLVSRGIAKASRASDQL
jgi:hypothetical protein